MNISFKTSSSGNTEILKNVEFFIEQILQEFATSEDFSTILSQAFGSGFNLEEAELIRKQWLSGDFQKLPIIEVRSNADINKANAAFSQDTNTIYIAQEYLVQNSQNPRVLINALLQEIGHFVDSQINTNDSPGDEGAIFAALARGQNIAKEEIAGIQQQDDTATITLDGQVIQIEQATVSDSGGFEGSQQTVKLESKNGGVAKFSYQHFSIPDNFIIRYEGKNILETGFVGGSRSGNVKIPKGNSDELEVIVATNNQGTAWNYTVETLDSKVEIKEVKLEHKKVSSGQWIETSETVDGNKVRIKPIIENTGDTDTTVKVKIIETNEDREISRSQTVTISANGNQELEFEWDTNGYAWDSGNTPLSNRKVKVIVEDITDSKELDSETEDLKVIPKPLVLAHGLWSSASTWGSYDGFVRSVHPDWKAFAVGDGKAPGVMDTGTGFLSGLFQQQVNTIFQNAQQMSLYVDGVRKNLNAEYVDVVGHSMGGLISRQYINSLMPRSQDGKSVVNKLLMLGTPNGGAPFASLPVSVGLIGSIGLPTGNIPAFIPAVQELTVAYITNNFNQRVTNRKSIPFSILAGSLIPTPVGISIPIFSRLGFIGTLLDSFDFASGDIVVPVESAINGYGTFPIADAETRIFRLHTAMPGSQADFSSFVLPRLALDSSELGNTAPRLRQAAFNTNFDTIAVPALDDVNSTAVANSQILPLPQIFFSAAPELSANGTTEIDIPVPEGSDLFLNYIAPDSVSATLLAPDGTVVSTTSAGTPESAQFLRFFNIQTPNIGTYKLRLEQQGGTTGNVPVAAVIAGNPLELNINVGNPDGNNQSQINAILTNAGSPVTNATVLANVLGINGYQKVLTLLDDGQNGDGLAGDGIYGSKTESLAGGGYNVAIQAQGSDFLRIASDAISIAEPNQANLSLRQIELLDSGVIGENVTYTFEVSNIGPNDATGVLLVNSLPLGVDFVSAAGGSYNPANRTVTFDLGDLTNNASTSANIVVKRTVTGGLRSIATVTATELDVDLSNNTVETSGIDLLLKRTANQAVVNLGEEYTYTLTVANNGLDDATSVVLTENLPSGVNFVRSTGATSVRLFGERLTANLGNIASGDSATVNLTFKSIVAGNLLGTSTVRALEDDYNTANNSLISTTIINPITPASADLELTKTVSTINPNVGDRITFNLNLTNKGPGIASGIKVSDLLPSGLSFVSALAAQGIYDSRTGVWDVGNIRDNLSRSLRITANVVSAGVITNTAEIIDVNEADPDSTPGNNNPNEDDQASVTITTLGINPGQLVFSGAAYSVNEDGTPIQAVTISRTGGSDGAVGITITPSNGTTTAPDDYNNAPITVNFASLETSKTVAIPIVDDTLVEGDETINLTLGKPTGGAVLGTQTTAVLTIVDNDTVTTPGINIDGTPNDDNLTGTPGNDTIRAFNSQDILRGLGGSDTLDGGDGDDKLFGGDGNDSLLGGSGQDQIFGEVGNDTLNGGDGDDKLFGGDGDDILFGGQGNDQLVGDAGDDILTGGSGDNILTGGLGKDIFVLSTEGKNNIIDFQSGLDLIGLSGGLTFGSLSISAQNNGTVINTINNQPLAFLASVNSNSITASDFVLI